MIARIGLFRFGQAKKKDEFIVAIAAAAKEDLYTRTFRSFIYILKTHMHKLDPKNYEQFKFECINQAYECSLGLRPNFDFFLHEHISSLSRSGKTKCRKKSCGVTRPTMSHLQSRLFGGRFSHLKTN